ncbi:MAG: hypothetical protein ACP5T5_04345 [Thermoprotei archaeon]
MSMRVSKKSNGYRPHDVALIGGMRWAVIEALKNKNDDEKELKDWMTTETGETATFSLIPLLDLWADGGIVTKKENDKGSLSDGTVLGPRWVTIEEPEGGGAKEGEETVESALSKVEESVEYLSEVAGQDKDSLSIYAPVIKDLIVKLTDLIRW